MTELLPPDEWAKRKTTPLWKLNIARAYHLAQTSPPLRVPWLPGGQLLEADFDAAVDRACNATLR